MNSSSGGLTLSTTLTVSAAEPTAHPSLGYFAFPSGNSIACYKFDFRKGSPTAMSSVAVSGPQGLQFSRDGNFLYYGKSGVSSLFWRSFSDCSFGTESSIAMGGGGQVNGIRFSSDSSVLFAVTDATGTLARYSRNTSSGALTFGTSVVAGGATSHSFELTPNDRFILTSDGGGILSLNSTTLATISAPGTPWSGEAIALFSNTLGGYMASGKTHDGFTISASGVVTDGGWSNLGVGDFSGGIAMSPDRNFLYTGDGSSSGVWVHKASSAWPYVNTPTLVNTGSAPSGIAYLTGWAG